MTYLNFLLIFIIPLVIIGLLYLKNVQHPTKPLLKEGMFLLILLAVVYTTPWDNYLVKTGVWDYEEHNILFKIGYVPIEEYSFFVLQSILTCCWCYFIFNKIKMQKASSSTVIKHVISGSLVVLLGFSIYWLAVPNTRYLGLILAWVTPVFLLQWLVGGEHILRNMKVFLACLLPPTLYLWAVDGFAIFKNTWAISGAQTVGFKIYTLPLEEAVFFLVTNVMLVQGLILYILLKNDLKLYLARKK